MPSKSGQPVFLSGSLSIIIIIFTTFFTCIQFFQIMAFFHPRIILSFNEFPGKSFENRLTAFMFGSISCNNGLPFVLTKPSSMPETSQKLSMVKHSRLAKNCENHKSFPPPMFYCIQYIANISYRDVFSFLGAQIYYFNEIQERCINTYAYNTVLVWLW